MRSLLVVLLAMGAAFAGWWLLIREPGSSPPERVDPIDGGRPAGRLEARPDTGRVFEAPRIGVVQGGEGQLGRSPDDLPWHEQQVRVGRSPKGTVTGAVLLEALAQHYYVRAKTLAELDEIRAQVVEVEPDSTLPVPVVVSILEGLGYRVAVHEPVIMLAKRPPGSGEEPPPPR